MSIQRRINNTIRTLLYGAPEHPGENICFIHVPKSGGTSISSAVSGVMQGKTLCEISTADTNKIVEALIVQDDTKYSELYQSRLSYRKSLAAYQMVRGGGLVYGHFSVDPRFLDWFSNEHGYKFVTLLRNPIDRWISQFVYRMTHHENKDSLASPDLSVIHSAIVSNWGSTMANVLLYYFGCDGHGGYSVDQAIENLSRFTFVGRLDRIGDLSELTRNITGRGDVPLGKHNVSGGRSGLVDTANQWKALFTDSVRMELSKACERDLEIFDRVLQNQVRSN